MSGTLTGSGDLTMSANGQLDWTGGTMSGGGKVTIPETAQLNISGVSTKILRDRTIDNLGTTTWTGVGDIWSGFGAVFNNLANATFDAQNDRSFIFNLGGTASQFNNAGTFKKTVSTGTTTMALFFNNTGTIGPLSGTVNFTGGGNNLPP